MLLQPSLGINAPGFVFVHGSPQYLDDATAAALVQQFGFGLPRWLFLDQGAEQVRQG
jgi:hypothetical protein